HVTGVQTCALPICWFRRAFAAPTPAQVGAWPSIRAGRSTLVAAPTGSGKTLTAFLATLDELLRLGLAGALEDRTRVVYVSPLKARSEEHTSELQSRENLVCRLLLEKNK